MRMCTRSKRVIKAIDRVLWRLPPKDREVIERFVFRITSVRAWMPVHVDGVDSTSAMLTRFWKAGDGGIKCERRPTGELHCERTGDTYEAQVCFNLPVVRLFSDRALVGIVAHEFAHGCIAARLGQPVDYLLGGADLDRELAVVRARLALIKGSPRRTIPSTRKRCARWNYSAAR